MKKTYMIYDVVAGYPFLVSPDTDITFGFNEDNDTIIATQEHGEDWTTGNYVEGEIDDMKTFLKNVEKKWGWTCVVKRSDLVKFWNFYVDEYGLPSSKRIREAASNIKQQADRLRRTMGYICNYNPKEPSVKIMNRKGEVIFFQDSEAWIEREVDMFAEYAEEDPTLTFEDWILAEFA